MKCPNKCGNIAEIEKPCFIPTDPEILSYLPMLLRESEKKNLIACRLILRVCPKCGYYECKDLNENQMEKYLEEERNAGRGKKAQETTKRA